MLVGANISSGDSIPVLQNKGSLDFVEILIDNYFHIDPYLLKEFLDDLNVAFHIMNSGFVFDKKRMVYYTSKIKEFSRVLNPLYISDHLFYSKVHDFSLKFPIEFDYSKDKQLILNSVDEYQTRLNDQVLFENFPSLNYKYHSQSMFFKEMSKATGCGILFDVSNALIAELNSSEPVSDWFNLDLAYFHIGGFERIDGVYVDTHNKIPNKKSIEIFNNFFSNDAKTLILEWDFNQEIDKWINLINIHRDKICVKN